MRANAFHDINHMRGMQCQIVIHFSLLPDYTDGGGGIWCISHTQNINIHMHSKPPLVASYNIPW